MLRTVLLSKADEQYLEKCAQEHKFSFGIIVGHQAELNKSIVVHLARNNEEDADMEDLTDVRLNITDINPQTLASQWLSASKMCPGSCDVIGIFVSSVHTALANEHSGEMKNAKKLFSDVYDMLMKSSNTFGVYTTDVGQSDYVFLVYSLADKKIMCKSYTHGNGGTFSNMECRFVEKPFEWIRLECSYDLDDIVPITQPDQKINIEEQFQNIILTVRTNLMASEVFLLNEPVEDTIELQAYIKKKRGKDDKSQQQQNKQGGSTTNIETKTPTTSAVAVETQNSSTYLHDAADEVIRATIVLPVKCQLTKDSDIKVREFNGAMRMSGIISTRIFCNPRNSIADVKRFLRDDVLRSLTTRIQVYCDGLTDPLVTNDELYISEPPRRIFFNLPVDGSGCNNVQFSEYLFRGEAPTVAVAQAKQILDVDLDPQTIQLNAEGLPDESQFTNSSTHSDQFWKKMQGKSMPNRELTRNLYMLGIVIALLVLLISVALHYVMASF